MPRQRKTPEEEQPKPQRKALSPEARENQLIAYAVDLAEKQLREGTASSQVITHYLKLGTMREKLELETMRLEKDLIEAKISSLKSAQHTEELYQNALNAMKRYSGRNSDDENV